MTQLVHRNGGVHASHGLPQRGHLFVTERVAAEGLSRKTSHDDNRGAAVHPLFQGLGSQPRRESVEQGQPGPLALGFALVP